jgi:hypothetical protein
MSFHFTTGIADKVRPDQKVFLMKALRSLFKDNTIIKFLSQSVKGQYRPEKHYMRGPGPKAKAKFAPGGAKQHARPDVGQQAKRR